MATPVGVLLNSEYPARELIRLGRLAEDLGYDQLWYTDNRLFRECFLGLGALAAETSRILVGPGVTRSLLAASGRYGLDHGHSRRDL